MVSSPLRAIRTRAGFTQTQLAAKSGVSRQLIGAAEAGRHLPRVDAALAIAGALGVDVTALFPVGIGAVDVRTGSSPEPGSIVRLGRVGDTEVTTPLRFGRDGWGHADGVVEDGNVSVFEATAPGFVVIGCEPGLEILESMLRQDGRGGLAITASTHSALESLAAGRAHAAIVHGSGESRPKDGVERLRFATWRVGIAAPPEARPGWLDRLLDGSGPIVQRESGAAAQSALMKAIPDRDIAGPVARSHVDAIQIGASTGMASVTIEPVALAAGLEFRALETHQVDLLVDNRWRDDPMVSSALTLMASPRFLRRLRAFGGYDLSDHGMRVA